MWEPSNEIEHRLREALRADDQDGYFRILSQIELVLPLSYEDPNGLGGADTWATWTTDDRTHILAFTSETSLGMCLRDNAGSSRRVRFSALAEAWPDEEWWLAVNPGLPIEGYLPAWFVSQVAQGMTTVPADPAPVQPEQHSNEQSFASMAQSDPFANPMEPAPPARENSFMPAAPPVPEVPPAPRRSPNQDTGGSTVAGTTGAGLPLRQPPPMEPEAPAPQPSSFGEQTFTSQPPASAFPEQSQWPEEQTGWPDAPDWLREQQADPSSLPQRAPVDPYQSQPDPYRAPSQPESVAPPPQYQSEPQQTGAPTSDSFASMSSAFGRKPAAQAEPGSQPGEPEAPAPVELSGAEAEPRLTESAAQGDTAGFLHTLLCSTVILPVGDPDAVTMRVGDPAFRWASDIVDGIHGITVYTTVDRMRARAGEDTPHTEVPFGWLIQHWPGVEYALYVNPGTEVGANMSGPEIEPLIKWAEAKGLLAFAAELERRQAAEARAKAPSQRVKPVLWQKTIPHHQVPFYLERGYDRVGGLVHPAGSVEHLRTPAQLYLALGLIRSSEDFSPTDDTVHVLRWVGYRTDLYPPALGGNDDSSAEVNGGWIVEPSPFRGDGLAPSESPDDRIPEHKVDSVRLPHGAQILRIDSRGEVTELAVFDADTRDWTLVDGAAAIEASLTPAPASEARDEPRPGGPMADAAPGYGGYDGAGYESSALGDAFGPDLADGHYDLVRPTPEDKASSVLDHREWKGA
ncbi:SseB family protein [Glycomyces sp. L485]|uniref:SseB family protein n=1 Tax=Glycomyces sp. L485 TaxID=2909235 RepID=UPI001F4B9303|nr:SseB family protein [Glycomyces sp. L485]MCH7230655.1 SseB family protein [Glycomyces sp. L485]